MKLKTPEINAELTLFCPRRTCRCYQRSDNKLTKDGAYITKNDPISRQMFYCGVENIGFLKRVIARYLANNILLINLFDYNYRRTHKSLRLAVKQLASPRFQKKWQHRTPAMAMGLTNQALSWRFLL
jgi:hypothetical protein